MKYLLYVISFICVAGCKPIYEQPSTDTQSGRVVNTIPSKAIVKNDKESISMTGTILSGINISGDYISIINSGNTILYDKTFGITVSKEYQNREYDLSFSPVSDYPIIFLGIIDKNNTLSIRHFLLTDIQTNDSKNKSIKEICTPIYEEGINYKPKTAELKQGNQIYYLTYAKFSLMKFKPSEPQHYNYQAEICFVKNNKVYEITIGDRTHYRTDIVDSLKFL